MTLNGFVPLWFSGSRLGYSVAQVAVAISSPTEDETVCSSLDPSVSSPSFYLAHNSS